jgi:hypothetical protein
LPPQDLLINIIKEPGLPFLKISGKRNPVKENDIVFPGGEVK